MAARKHSKPAHVAGDRPDDAFDFVDDLILAAVERAIHEEKQHGEGAGLAFIKAGIAARRATWRAMRAAGDDDVAARLEAE
jgi:hypothetical protein